MEMELTAGELHIYLLKMLKEIVEICEKHKITYFMHGGSALGAVRHKGPVPWDDDADIVVPENQINKLCNVLCKELSDEFYVDYYLTSGNKERKFPRVGLTGYKTDVLHIDLFRLVGLPEESEIREKIVKKHNRIAFLFHWKTYNFNNVRKRRNIITLALIKILLLPITSKFLLRRYNRLCSLHPYEYAPYRGCLASDHGVSNHFKKIIYDEYVMCEYEGLKVRVVKEYDLYLAQLFGNYMELPPEDVRNEKLNTVYNVEKLK